MKCTIFLLFAATSIFANNWNNPYIDENDPNVRHSAFIEQPKTLDPARAYSSDEVLFLAQIYEPLLQYHYLKRPYQLIPLTTTEMPTVTYYDKNNQILVNNNDPKKIAFSIYDIYIKPHIYYQPHPALAKGKNNHALYLHLSPEKLQKIHKLSDFKYTGTRELRADDYIYEIKRIASPVVQSSIFGLMSRYILGFTQFNETLEKWISQHKNTFLDLRKFPLAGVKALGPYHFQIKIKGFYPQFKYWLAMTFFVPIPWEADEFYSQAGMKNKNISFDWYPLGTGPYLIEENNPNKEIILSVNPYFHTELFPNAGEANDQQQGYLKNANQRLPFIKKIIFKLDKESIPRWNKFLQGYYDKSGIGSDNFDQAIKLDKNGKPVLTPEIQKLGIRLQTVVMPTIFYLGFNMLDPVVGGYSEKKSALRRAISIALDYEEYISIFNNGRGVAAQSPLPPGMIGYIPGANGINPYVYYWKNNKPYRRSLTEAKQLLSQAGYPHGIDPKTGHPLILNYDVAISGNPDDAALLNWYRKAFAQLGITLNIRATLYNRFRDKVQKGHAQIFSWGWHADYPDAENFLFLLYSPNGSAKYGGENTANYASPKADQLFEQIRDLPNGPIRQQKIKQMLDVIQKDAPWVWGFHPVDFILSHQWNYPSKPNALANNVLKYERIKPKLRDNLIKQWNNPIILPLFIILFFVILIAIPLLITYWRKEHHPAVKRY